MKRFTGLNVFINRKIIVPAVLFLTFLIIAGCGSGGTGTPSVSVVSGVAAAGAPIIGTVSLKDSTNHEIGPISIGAGGSFSFNVTGLTPPFYLLTRGHVGSTNYVLYSVTTSSSGIANINPLTNAVVAAAAGGIDPASVYENPSSHPVSKTDIDKAITDLQAMLMPLLAEHDAGNIDPISDSYTADHTKLDRVFDLIAITVDSSGGDVLVIVTDTFTGDVVAGGSTGDLENPTTTTPIPPANVPKDVLSIGADRLVATQNNDGGWEWENPDTDKTTGISAPNTLGVTVQGILDAYKVTGNPAYLTACLKTYDLLVSNSTNTDTAFPLKHRIRGTDITFLVELSEATGDSKYAAFAKTRYQAAVDEFAIAPDTHTATGLAEYIRDLRKSQGLPALISWDINLYIQGVLALNRYYAGLGFDTDANLMAEVIYKSLYAAAVDFDLSNPNHNQNSYWLAYTGAIEAFTTTGLHSDKIDSLKTALVTSQQQDGHFPEFGGDSVSQTTAYAVMALLKAGGNDANKAAKEGVKYLVTNQSPNGGWVEYPTALPTVENTEVTGEAIHAIYNFKTPSSGTTTVTVGPSGDYLTIQAAINAAAPGDTIKVSAGTYNETINITKRVTIIGAGSGDTGTVLANSGGQTDFVKLPQIPGVTYGAYRPNVIINASGIDRNNPVLLKDLQIKPGPNIGYPRPGIILQPGAAGAGYVASYSYVELNNVRIIGDQSGDSPGQADPHVLPVSTNARGITVDGSTSLYHLVVKNCEFSDMTYGMIFYNNAAHPSTVQDVQITNTTFARNAVKGFYAEKLSDATFTDVTAAGNGIIARAPYYWAWSNAGIDINLKNGVFKNLVFNNLTVTGNGIGSYAGAGLTVKARGTGNDDPSLLATLDKVTVTGGTYTGNTVGIRFGDVTSPPPPAYWDPPAQSRQNTSPTIITIRGATVSGNTAGDIVNDLNGVTIHN